jgi:hypothetical protein
MIPRAFLGIPPGRGQYSGLIATCQRNAAAAAYSSNGGKNWNAASTPPATGGWYGMAFDQKYRRLVSISNGSTYQGLSTYSLDGGKTWAAGGTLPNPNPSGTPITAWGWYYVEYDPVNQHLIACAESSVISAYSADGGATWTTGGALPLAGKTSPQSGAYWYPMCWDPVHQRMVTIASTSTDSNGANSAYTTDGGVTWTPGGYLPYNESWFWATFDLVHSRIVVVSGSGNSHSAYSSDGGSTWSAGGSMPSVPSGAWHTCCYDPIHARVVALSDDAGSSIVAGSSDGGTTWTTISSSLSGQVWRSLRFDPVYGALVACNYTNSAIIYSLDGGVTWTSVSMTITCGPSHAIVIP